MARLLSVNYSQRLERFVAAGTDDAEDAVPHYGRPGGVLPRIIDESGRSIS